MKTSPQEYIDWGGSKAGVTFYLLDNHPELHKNLPVDNYYLEPDDDNVDDFVDKIKLGTRNKIIRTCRSEDFAQGLVDVLPSQKYIPPNREAIKSWILSVRQSIRENEDIASFFKYETGKNFDKKAGILVQDDYGDYRGSIIENPHERGVYRVEIVNPDKDHLEHTTCSLNGMHIEGEHEQSEIERSGLYPNSDILRQVIETYKRIQNTEIAPETHSCQMEFVVADTIKAVQYRIFRKYQPKADFDVPFESSLDQIETDPYSAFGITPVDGIDLLIVDIKHATRYEQDLNQKVGDARNNIVSHLVYYYDNGYSRVPTNLKIQPTYMKAYLALQDNFLEHAHYRWLQKADVAIVNASNRLIADSGTRFVNIRCNGVEGVVKKIM